VHRTRVLASFDVGRSAGAPTETNLSEPVASTQLSLESGDSGWGPTGAYIRLPKYSTSHTLRERCGWIYGEHWFNYTPEVWTSPNRSTVLPPKSKEWGLRFNVETEALRYNLPKNLELTSLPTPSGFSWSITHQHQDCISGKQDRGVEGKH